MQKAASQNKIEVFRYPRTWRLSCYVEPNVLAHIPEAVMYYRWPQIEATELTQSPKHLLYIGNKVNIQQVP